MNIQRCTQISHTYSMPFLLLVDMQAEYVSEGRAHYLSTAEACLGNIAALLETTRERRLPIAHFRQLRKGHFFNKASRFSHWITGFVPRANEYVYEHSMPSCFSCAPFCELMNNIQDHEIIIAGLSGDHSCLATITEAYHRGYRATFVRDCSTSRQFGGLSETQTHAVIADLASCYGEVLTLRECVNRLSKWHVARSGM